MEQTPWLIDRSAKNWIEIPIQVAFYILIYSTWVLNYFCLTSVTTCSFNLIFTCFFSIQCHMLLHWNPEIFIWRLLIFHFDAGLYNFESWQVLYLGIIRVYLVISICGNKYIIRDTIITSRRKCLKPSRVKTMKTFFWFIMHCLSSAVFIGISLNFRFLCSISTKASFIYYLWSTNHFYNNFIRIIIFCLWSYS